MTATAEPDTAPPTPPATWTRTRIAVAGAAVTALVAVAVAAGFVLGEGRTADSTGGKPAAVAATARASSAPSPAPAPVVEAAVIGKDSVYIAEGVAVDIPDMRALPLPPEARESNNIAPDAEVIAMMVQFTNDSGAPFDLGYIDVELRSGPAKLGVEEAIFLTADQPKLSGILAPGDHASGMYLFPVPAGTSDELAVTVSAFTVGKVAFVGGL